MNGGVLLRNWRRAQNFLLNQVTLTRESVFRPMQWSYRETLDNVCYTFLMTSCIETRTYRYKTFKWTFHVSSKCVFTREIRKQETTSDISMVLLIWRTSKDWYSLQLICELLKVRRDVKTCRTLYVTLIVTYAQHDRSELPVPCFSTCILLSISSQ